MLTPGGGRVLEEPSWSLCNQQRVVRLRLPADLRRPASGFLPQKMDLLGIVLDVGELSSELW